MQAKPLLIETIRISNGRVRNIKYHNQRCNKSRVLLFGVTNHIDLRKYIDTNKAISPQTKCRITYQDEVINIDYEPYHIRPINSLAFIEIGDYDYSFKYANRTVLKSFFDQRGDNDDILMTRNGIITDTYYANVALKKKENWYTPKQPLLAGTRRAKLIQEKKIIPTDIHLDQINEYECISLFNAMISLGKILVKF